MSDSTRRKIARLQRWNQKIADLSKQFSTYRLITFSIGVFLTWIAFQFIEGYLGWIFLVGSIVGFLVVVWCHQRVDRWVQLSEARLDIEELQLARQRLDWENIPEPDPHTEAQDGLQVDLDLVGYRSLHHLMDNTISDAGSQRLANWLSQESPDLDAIHTRQIRVAELTSMHGFRTRLSLLYLLSWDERLDTGLLNEWIRSPAPVARLRRILPLASILAVANITLFILNLLQVIPPFWMLSLGVYALFYFMNYNQLSKHLSEIVEVNEELNKLRSVLFYLERYSYRGKPNLASLCELFHASQPPPSHKLRRVSLATAAVGLRSNPVIALLINTVLPWDFGFAYLAARLKDDIIEVLPKWLETWVELEALNALANFAYLNPGYHFPVVSDDLEEVLATRLIGHPLIAKEQVVCNNFRIDDLGGIAIITGSNMAGKSTFLKTVGTNLCLAYAGAPVFADSLQMRPLRLHTCMKISDSIIDGYSYFYAEVRCLKNLRIKVNRKDEFPVLYLVDEIFRGTNNRERLIGSRAYIRSMMGENASGLIATHDLELANLAVESPNILNYHFRDKVLENRLIFDYRIHPGPSPTTNALRIMQMEGLPIDGGSDAD